MKHPRRSTVILVGLGCAFLISVVILMRAIWGPTSITEEEGKRIVAETTEVQAMLAEHGEEHVRVLALEQHRVHDRDLIAALYPDVSRDTVTCVIVATAGDEGYVFLQGEDFRILQTESLNAFAQRTRDADPRMLAHFWLSLA